MRLGNQIRGDRARHVGDSKQMWLSVAVSLKQRLLLGEQTSRYNHNRLSALLSHTRSHKPHNLI